MKKSELKSWVDAIDVAIDMHQEAIDKNIDYLNVKNPIIDSSHHCPLCLYYNDIKTESSIDCGECPWIKYTGDVCMYNRKYDYYNNKQSIKRLKHWRELELKSK